MVGRQEPTFGDYFSEPDADNAETDFSKPEMDVADDMDAQAGGDPDLTEEVAFDGADPAQNQGETDSDAPIDPGTMDWLDEIESVPTSQAQSATAPARRH